MCLVDQLSWYVLILKTELIGVSVRAQSDAWRGQWHREHPEEPGHREDDCGGLWHPAGHQPDLRQAGYVFINSQFHQTAKLWRFSWQWDPSCLSNWDLRAQAWYMVESLDHDISFCNTLYSGRFGSLCGSTNGVSMMTSHIFIILSDSNN